MTGEVVAQLGHHLRRRRMALGLSVSAAAKVAGVSRVSWTAWESDVSKPQGHNYAGIEKTLRWAPGSLEEVLAGADPQEVQPEAGPLLIDDLPQDLQRLIDLYVSPDLNDREREDILTHARMAYRGTLLSMRQRADEGRPPARLRRPG